MSADLERVEDGRIESFTGMGGGGIGGRRGGEIGGRGGGGGGAAAGREGRNDRDVEAETQDASFAVDMGRVEMVEVSLETVGIGTDGEGGSEGSRNVRQGKGPADLRGLDEQEQSNGEVIDVERGGRGERGGNEKESEIEDSCLSQSLLSQFDELLIFTHDPSSWFKESGRRIVNRYAPVLSGLLYCSMSCGMILLNKAVLSGYHFPATYYLLAYQNLVSVLVVVIGSNLGFFEVEPLTWSLCRVWFPVNCLFVGMIASGLYSLKYLSVAMVTILKNLTNVITASGEHVFYGKRHSMGVWSALGLIILSSVCGGITDLTFTLKGYTWQFVNCLLTAGYSLYLKKAMALAQEVTSSGRIGEVSMVMLNNALSLPMSVILLIGMGEVEVLASSPLMTDLGFWIAATLTGLLGACLCFSVMWFLHSTSPTTFGLVGSLNKVPTSFIGMALFPVKTPASNVFSIALGLAAGVVFTLAKLREQRAPT
ncbi:hypothetical protein CBR_g31067 [Chara braunii]|uniref:Sugar phosphate transporter domain-containing protein n=1 Tax=Chara braunii TaxID=69332 RepID=A0A388LEB3_CHABU|nr:hypothetical protein CBR_g31067 [Chara braunii]|eukprot:GBG80607.1 hypothetical protein CBR_g31067 [Chara braunii]